MAPLVARVWSWRCDWLVGGLLGVAVCGVATSLRDVWLANRHHSHSWIIGILTVLASNDTRIYRVFAVLGFFHSMRVAVIAVEKVAKVQLTRWGQMVLEVRR